jgi:hypothetical protein
LRTAKGAKGCERSGEGCGRKKSTQNLPTVPENSGDGADLADLEEQKCGFGQRCGFGGFGRKSADLADLTDLKQKCGFENSAGLSSLRQPVDADLKNSRPETTRSRNADLKKKRD